MKIYIPTNPYWYIAVVVFFGPYFAGYIFSQIWVVKLFAISVFYLGIPLLFLVYGLTNKLSKTINEEAYFIKKYGKKHVVLTGRIIFIFIGCVFLLLLPSLIKDIIFISNNSFPLTRVAVITRQERWGVPGGLIFTNIEINGMHDTSEKKFDALYFPLRYFQVGDTYEFLYLPNTHWILEAHLINEK